MIELPNGNEVEFEVAHNLMNDGICELINQLHAPCSEQFFVDEYCKAHEQIFGEEFTV
jgi:hypothetical protein